MLDQIAQQLGAPASAAFEKGEVELRETTGHPAEKNRLGDGMTGGGEMADVVVDKVGRRQAQALTAAAAVEGRCDAELEAFRPDRVVVVRAVDAEHVVPHRKAARLAILGLSGRDGPRQVAAKHANL